MISEIMTIELKQILEIGDLSRIARAVPLITIPEPSIGANFEPVFLLIFAVNTAIYLTTKVINKVAPNTICTINK
jgi:hypothetical protein